MKVESRGWVFEVVWELLLDILFRYSCDGVANDRYNMVRWCPVSRVPYTVYL